MSKVQIGNCTLYLGDCLEIMPTLGKVDAVVTDPPYGIGESNKNFASRGKLASADKYKQSNWDNSLASDAVDYAISISKYQIIFGGNYYSLPPTSCWLVWDKMAPDNDFADCELAWTNLSKAVRRLKYLWNGCMRYEKHIERVHPTQKPVGVMRWCLSHLPNTVETILDPFMGSGTTGVACAERGFKFIGIEQDPYYFAHAQKRIKHAQSQPDMFIEAERQKQPEQVMLDLAEQENGK